MYQSGGYRRFLLLSRQSNFAFDWDQKGQTPISFPLSFHFCAVYRLCCLSRYQVLLYSTISWRLSPLGGGGSGNASISKMLIGICNILFLYAVVYTNAAVVRSAFISHPPTARHLPPAVHHGLSISPPPHPDLVKRASAPYYCTGVMAYCGFPVSLTLENTP